VTPRVRSASSVRRRWPLSSGHRRHHGRHDAPHSLASSTPSLSLSLSRDSDGGNALATVAESSASFARARLRVSPHPRVSPSPPRASPSSAPLGWTRSPRGELHFASLPSSRSRGRDPIPANHIAAPSLPSFFPPSRVRVCLGLGCGPCHAIPALLLASRGNTATAPPRSPPTSTPHVSRVTGAIRVTRFYLESSALSHWCLSHSSPMLYRSEMAGVSQGGSAVPPWPTATPHRRSNPRVTHLYRCGITLGARCCPWIRRKSSPSASIRRRVCPLFSGPLTRGTRCQ